MLSMLVNSRSLPIMLLLIGLGHSAQAQQQSQPQPAKKQTQKAQQQAQEAQPQPKSQQKQGAQSQPQPISEDVPVKERDYSTERQQPPPPTPPKELQGADNLEVAVDAGVGSPLAYGKKTVVELGGSLALTHSSDTTLFSILPQAGYFIADGFELSLFPEFRIVSVNDDTDYSIGVAFEPSYHLALSEDYYVFGGLGIGLRYAEDPGLDLFFRPRIGVDIMIGRSGILKPAVFIDVGVNEGTSAGGLEAAFTVML